jgi:hypothetical protein
MTSTSCVASTSLASSSLKCGTCPLLTRAGNAIERHEHAGGHSIRWIGRELHADADVNLDLAAAHDVLEDARHRLLHRIPRLGDILLHADPAGQPDAHDRTNHPRATVTAPALY